LAASDPEEKRLRRLTRGELADEAGAHKTALARIKDEANRGAPRAFSSQCHFRPRLGECGSTVPRSRPRSAPR
jgi:hypothetical protein